MKMMITKIGKGNKKIETNQGLTSVSLSIILLLKDEEEELGGLLLSNTHLLSPSPCYRECFC